MTCYNGCTQQYQSCSLSSFIAGSTTCVKGKLEDNRLDFAVVVDASIRSLPSDSYWTTALPSKDAVIVFLDIRTDSGSVDKSILCHILLRRSVPDEHVPFLR